MATVVGAKLHVLGTGLALLPARAPPFGSLWALPVVLTMGSHSVFSPGERGISIEDVQGFFICSFLWSPSCNKQAWTSLGEGATDRWNRGGADEVRVPGVSLWHLCPLAPLNDQ